MVSIARVLAAIVVAATLLAHAHAQNGATCKVIDPELQGGYVGGCVNGLAEGVGEARGKAVYGGDFVGGRKHGKGVKTWPRTGDRYEGEFADDRRQGTGTYVWGERSLSPGERYTGGYAADRRQGYGVYEWPGGDRYAGPWENDAPTGTPTKGMIARARSLAERAAIVGVSGTRVCREVRIGVATLDTVRGTVLGRHGDTLRVRVDDAGKFQPTIDDRTIVKGDVLTEPLRLWLPCS